MAVAIGLVVQAFTYRDIGHGDQRRGIGRGLDEDMLIGQLAARAGDARIHGDDAHALLLRLLEVLRRAGAERAVGRAPAPHQDQLGIHIVSRLAAGGLVVGLGAEGDAHREHLGFGRHVRPQLGAAAELVEEALGHAEAREHRRVARARRVEERRVAVSCANAHHLAGDMVHRLVPRDALEPARAARAGAAHRIFQPVGMIDALDLPDAACAGLQGRHVRRPARLIGRDVDDAAILDMGVHHAAAAAIVAAGRGDNGLAVTRGPARVLVDRVVGHGPNLRPFLYRRSTQRGLPRSAGADRWLSGTAVSQPARRAGFIEAQAMNDEERMPGRSKILEFERLFAVRAKSERVTRSTFPPSCGLACTVQYRVHALIA